MHATSARWRQSRYSGSCGGRSEALSCCSSVHAQGHKECCGRVWRLACEDDDEYLLWNDVLPTAHRLAGLLQSALRCGRQRETILQDRLQVGPRRLVPPRQRWGVESRGDADGVKCLSVEQVERLTGRVERDAKCGRDLRIVEQAEHQVLGAHPAIASPARLFPGSDVGRPGVVRLRCSRSGRHHRSLPYLRCTDCRVTPSASPICCQVHPCARAAATLEASTRSASRCNAKAARSPRAGSSESTALPMSWASILSVYLDSLDVTQD